MYVTTQRVSNGSDTLLNETNHCFRARKRLPSCELRGPLQLPCIVQERCSCSHRQIASHLIALEQLEGSDVPTGTADIPLYTMPELSLTVTGAPMISLRNPLGSLESPAASGPGLSPLVDIDDWSNDWVGLEKVENAKASCAGFVYRNVYGLG